MTERDITGPARRVEHQIQAVDVVIGELPAIGRRRGMRDSEVQELVLRLKATLRSLGWLRDNRQALLENVARGVVPPAPPGTTEGLPSDASGDPPPEAAAP